MKTLLLTLALASALPREALAQSLLLGEGKAGGQTGSPYDPPPRTPFKKHDHVQIMVQDRTRLPAPVDAKAEARPAMEATLKDWATIPVDAKGLPGKAAPGIPVDPKVGADGKLQAPTSRESDLTFAITAEVIDIRPNGVLVLQAMRRHKINEHDELLRLTGEVNPDAVVAGKVRLEALVRLSISCEGPADDARPGLLGRLLGRLWPF